MNNFYVIGDTHLHHDAMVQLGDRPKNHTELILKNWRETVKEGDVTFHLGDVTMQPSSLKEELDSIPGKKILIMGNHDDESAWWYMNNGFDLACEQITLTFKGYRLHLNHEPQLIRYPRDLYLCGHLHNNDPRNFGYSMKPQHRLFILENLKYRPIELSRFIDELCY